MIFGDGHARGRKGSFGRGDLRGGAKRPFAGIEVDPMKSEKLATLRFISLLFLLPGLAGLILSAMISTHYLEILPQWPTPQEMRMTPRSIHGIVVYQTEEEDHRLSLIENSSVGIFVIGLGLGLVYMEKWGSQRTREAEEENDLTQNYS
jgi:hypothetical protein